MCIRNFIPIKLQKIAYSKVHTYSCWNAVFLLSFFFPFFFCFCSSVCSSGNSLSKTVGELQEAFLLYLFEVSLGCLDVGVFWVLIIVIEKKKDQYSVAKYFYSVEFGNVWLMLPGLEKHHILARRQVLGCCVPYSFKTIELESRINLVLEKTN